MVGGDDNVMQYWMKIRIGISDDLFIVLLLGEFIFIRFIIIS